MSELERLYCEERLSTNKIAERLGTTRGVIYYRLRKIGIPFRSLSEADKGSHTISEEGRNRLSSLKKGQVPWWILKGMENPSKTESARNKISLKNKGKIPWDKGITRRPGEVPRGSNHYMWRGGRFPYYGEDWYSQRKKALIRDNFSCRDCGLDKESFSNNRFIHVHHIIPRFKGGTNNLENLITLCNNCHSKSEQLQRIKNS